jgi:hypothetical protein
MLREWASHADLHGKNAVGLMVRRERVQLLETIERSRVPFGSDFAPEPVKDWSQTSLACRRTVAAATTSASMRSFEVVHSAAIDSRSVSQCQGQWADQPPRLQSRLPT